MRPNGPWSTASPRASLQIWLRRLRFNLFPAFRATGARVIYISEDMRTLRIKLPLNRRTRNIHGTLFGGALYAATDPLYALLVKVAVGPGHIVLDKAGTIHYRRPGRSTLYAECSLSESEVAVMRKRLAREPAVDLNYEIEWIDENGVLHAIVEKTIYVARKEISRLRQGALPF
jgi:acyl-coenzyme A thioesterase PaaI-like protein